VRIRSRRQADANTSLAEQIDRTRRACAGIGLVLPGILWLLVFAIAPIGFLICLSFWNSTPFGIGSEWSLDNYVTVLFEPLYGLLLLKTLRIAILSTIMTLLISYPLAIFLSRLRGYTKSIFVVLVFLPFWTSYIVRTFVWLPLLGRTGVLNQLLISMGILERPIDWFLYNEGAVYLGLVYVYTLFMTLPIYLSLDKIDPSLIEAANDLGATPVQTFRRVILPLSSPGIWSGCIMVFLLSCGAFVTPQLLGGPSGIMFGNVIASQFLYANNWPLGATLSIMLMIVVLVSVFVAGRRLGLQQIFFGEH
jgi:spermidine/putrescine transport system permease protein